MLILYVSLLWPTLAGGTTGERLFTLSLVNYKLSPGHLELAYWVLMIDGDLWCKTHEDVEVQGPDDCFLPYLWKVKECMEMKIKRHTKKQT